MLRWKHDCDCDRDKSFLGCPKYDCRPKRASVFQPLVKGGKDTPFVHVIKTKKRHGKCC